MLSYVFSDKLLYKLCCIHVKNEDGTGLQELCVYIGVFGFWFNVNELWGKLPRHPDEIDSEL
jgi:hypothetical protein